MYRVFHPLVDLGWDDLDFECSTVCPILPGLKGIWQKRLGSWARRWNTQIKVNLTQVQMGHPVPGSAPGCRTGNREKLSSTQAEPGLAIKSGVAYFPSISCTTSWRRSRYTVHGQLSVWFQDRGIRDMYDMLARWGLKTPSLYLGALHARWSLATCALRAKAGQMSIGKLPRKWLWYL